MWGSSDDKALPQSPESLNCAKCQQTCNHSRSVSRADITCNTDEVEGAVAPHLRRHPLVREVVHTTCAMQVAVQCKQTMWLEAIAIRISLSKSPVNPDTTGHTYLARFACRAGSQVAPSSPASTPGRAGTCGHAAHKCSQRKCTASPRLGQQLRSAAPRAPTRPGLMAPDPGEIGMRTSCTAAACQCSTRILAARRPVHNQQGASLSQQGETSDSIRRM